MWETGSVGFKKTVHWISNPSPQELGCMRLHGADGYLRVAYASEATKGASRLIHSWFTKVMIYSLFDSIIESVSIQLVLYRHDYNRVYMHLAGVYE